MKRIAVDLRSLESPIGKRGVGYFNRNIFKHLLIRPHPNFSFTLFTFPNSKIRDQLRVKEGDNFKPIPSLLWSIRGFRRLDPFFSIFWSNSLKSIKPDLLHIPFIFDIYYVSIPDDIKTIVTLYDIIPLLFPGKYFQNEKAETWYKQRLEQAKKAAKIITISKSSKKDIEKILKIPSDRIEVIYGGVDENYKVVEKKETLNVLKKYKINKPYILTVSTHSFHKNTSKIFEVFKEYIISEKNEEMSLVVVGKLAISEEKDWKNQLKKMEIEKRVILTNFVKDREMPALYSGAEVFLFPSLYEGLGLPVLEAFACGTPVITSNVSSLPEVGGDAAVYINPKDSKDIRTSLVKVLKNENLKSQMIKNGFKQARKFSWSRAAEQTLDVYKEVLGNN